MFPIRFVSDDTNIDFIGNRFKAFAFFIVLMLGTLVFLSTRGLNMGIDFEGGILIETHAQQVIDLAPIRSAIEKLDLGDVEIQNFGTGKDMMIRVAQQKDGDEANKKAVEQIKQILGPDYEFDRIEMVGPKVGKELFNDGMLAIGLAMCAIAIYVAFRFEWQFGIAALAAIFIDVFLTLGLFSVFHLDFNLTAIAALLTLAGYSINDKIVVFDRIRENMRRFKSMPMVEILNLSINKTLSRTIMTSTATALALVPLLFYGGNSLLNFSAAMVWGIFIGTISSIYIASALLIYMKPIRQVDHKQTPKIA